MMIPSMVKTDRMRLRASARKATRNVEKRSIRFPGQLNATPTASATFPNSREACMNPQLPTYQITH
jgi:hypothetical protein